MKKYYSWMLTAILLICGLALTTSCGKEEAPFKLDGTWYGKVVDNEDYGIGKSVHYLPLTRENLELMAELDKLCK